MKKFLSVFLVFAFVIGVCFSAPFTLKAIAAEVDDLLFELNNNGESYYVSDCDESVSGDLEIPSTYNGLPVTSIGDYAFRDCTSLTSITIPDSVTSIGYEAFDGCTSLTSVNITNLAAWCNIDFGDEYANPLYYAENLYLNGKLVTELQIPGSVTSIGYYAFSGYTSLTSITIPDSVTSIGYEAFDGCTSLTSVNITNLAAWCNIDFGNSDANPLYYAKDLYLNGKLVTELQIPEGVTKIKDYAFYNFTSLSSITIPDSVTSIGSDAFVACTSLTSITIPDSVTSIGDRAFHYCTTLTSITIPNSVTSIGEDAFIDCTSLTNVNITNPATWCNIDFGNSDANPLYYAEDLYLNGELVTELQIPEGVTEIKPYAFYNCKSIISIKLPKSLKKVGSDAFYGCSNIEMVETSDLTAWCNIDFADEYANPLYYASDFYLNGKLVTELQIPEGVTQIRNYAFYNCSSLTSITIPDSVTSIGCEAFRNCTSLTSVNITNLVAWCNIDFGDVYANPLFCAENFYLNGELVTELQIPEGVTQIRNYAFRNCTSLTSIIIPESVTSISNRAFSDCTSLISITIGGNVTSIGDYAFYDCTSLKYVFYPGSSDDWNKISIGSNNAKLTSSSIHYNTTEHSCSVVKNLPFFEGMEGSIKEICSVCGFINSSRKLTFVNSYITADDTKNVVLDNEADMLFLDISACTDISDAIIEMDGFTITVIPNSSHGFIGTGSKLKVLTASGIQIAEYTLVVRGDVNGDSVCDVLDCMLVELARNNQTTLEGAYYAAANLAEDDQIDMNDFSAVVNRVFA